MGGSVLGHALRSLVNSEGIDGHDLPAPWADMSHEELRWALDSLAEFLPIAHSVAIRDMIAEQSTADDLLRALADNPFPVVSAGTAPDLVAGVEQPASLDFQPLAGPESSGNAQGDAEPVVAEFGIGAEHEPDVMDDPFDPPPFESIDHADEYDSVALEPASPQVEEPIIDITTIDDDQDDVDDID